MKRFLQVLFLCVLAINISCGSDNDDEKDPEIPSDVTNAIVLNDKTYNLTPVPATEFVKDEDSSQKVYNTYTVDSGVSDDDYCAAYYIVFRTQNGDMIEWWFNSEKDPFNTTYLYATECGKDVDEDYDSWFLLEADDKNDKEIFSAQGKKGHSITTSVKNNTLTIKGTFIDDITGNTGTINVSINNYVVK